MKYRFVISELIPRRYSGRAQELIAGRYSGRAQEPCKWLEGNLDVSVLRCVDVSCNPERFG